MAVTDDVVTDQRVLRHVEALREAGYGVKVVGRRGVKSGKWKVESGGEVVLMRLRHRRGWRFYAEFNWRLFWLLMRERPDVVWANDTDTLLGCWMAAKSTGRKLVLDCHELFPEVPEIQHKPLVKWVWRTLERWLMPSCDACLTVCGSIADYYSEKYGVEMTVVRNLGRTEVGGRRSEVGSRSSDVGGLPPSALRLLLYQGAVNLGRGVDWAIDALEWLPGCQLVVAGDGDLLEEMKAYAAGKPWAERVVFLGRLMPEELEPLTRMADVGLVMLEDMGLSYHYALPNRIGDFVHAGVPMVVSDLPEMTAVVRRWKVGEVMYGTGGRPLAEAVERVLAVPRESWDFAGAREDMDWEKEKGKIVRVVRNIFGSW